MAQSTTSTPAQPAPAAATSATKKFDLPAGDAASTLQAFTQQSGEQIVYPVEQVRGVQTNAVRGEFATHDALERMLSGTGLVVIRDEQSGALAIGRDSGPKGQRAVQKEESNRPEKITKTESGAIVLDPVPVLGSRIHQTDVEGPTPVNLYDAEYIRSTGALNVADFLKTLPQSYMGVPSGRASAPNEMNPESGLYTESSTPSYNYVTGNFDTPLGQTGVSGASLRGLGSGSTLVLVDGRRVTQSGAGNRSSQTQQGFVDLNTIPLGMVDHIEMITDGASALYGADAVAGVINIVLKKNWVGNELSDSVKVAEHGGGQEHSVSLTSGFTSHNGKLRGTINLNYYQRDPLKASQREFSANQNHTSMIAGYDASGNPVYGKDRRLNWGYPVVVQAVSGTLTGITDPSGAATRFAVLNEGTTGTATIADFTGVTASYASGIRRGDTAAFDDLIPSSKRRGVSGNFNYTINDRVEAYAKYYFSDTRGKTDTQPGVTSVSTYTGFGNYASVVPAAYNPFGQNVAIGMIHYGFGSIWQKTHTKAHNLTVGVSGVFGQTWHYDTGLNYQHQNMYQLTRNFNGAAITAALSNADASLRLNPFIDVTAAGNTQAAVYETMAIYPSVDTSVTLTSWDFQADGSVVDIWGGPIKMAFGGTASRSKNDATSISYSIAATPVETTKVTSSSRDSYAGFMELSVPLFGKPNARTLLRRLDLQLAGRYENQEDAGHTVVPKIGLTWTPVQSLMLRANYSKGFRAPALTEYEVSNSTYTGTITDPLRGGVSTSVSVTSGSNPNIKPETSHTLFYGLVFEPTFLKGLSLQVNYYDTEQNDVIQQLSAQTMVNNESVFPDRIIRADADASDIALGQPGKITAVDVTFDNYGTVRNRSMDFIVNYTLPWERLGTWRVMLNASHTLESSREFTPGKAAVDDIGDTYSAPKWNFTGGLYWRSGAWNASLFALYIDGFNTNSGGNVWTNNTTIVSSLYPSMWKLDVRGGYEFKQGVWRGHGKGLRVQLGISNLLDKEPPFADNMYGYNGSLHSQWVLGRAYELSFVLPF